MPVIGKDYTPGIQERVFQAKSVIENEFPGLWKPTEACLSVFAQLRIRDIVNCTFLTFIGSPASRKTTMLSWFNGLDCSYFTDEFSPTSFVSHYAGATETQLKEKIDLLPRVKGKVLITPELMPTYSAPYEELNKNLGIITKVLDGQGYSRDSGVHGQRGYKGVEGDWVFHWLAGIAYVPYRLWKMFGNMGTRAYYYGMPEENGISSKKLAEELKEDFSLKSKNCRNAIHSVINHLWNTYPEPIKWEKEKDEIETLEIISKLAILLSHLRGNIELQYEEEGENAQEVYTQPVIEQPHRANQVLYNLARGHALLYGRKYISRADLPLVIKVALDSAKTDRVKFFRCLLDNNGTASSKDFEQYLNISRPMAIKTIKSLKILGLVNIIKNNPSEQGGRPMYIAKLKDEYRWFLSQEFRALWRE